MTDQAIREAASSPSSAPLYTTVPQWRERFEVIAGMTTRQAGNFQLLPSCRPVVMPSWLALQSRLGFRNMVASRQVHGRDVAWHDEVQGWLLLDGFDGHATPRRGVLLTLTVADCVPVYVVDPVRGAAALLHAGWRGTAHGVLRAGVEKLVEVAGSRVRDLVIHLGVGICGRCYEVGSEVLDGCGRPVPDVGPFRLDLRQVLTEQARALGVTDVSTAAFCTAHDREVFLSHRASGGRDGRMAAYLGFPE